MSDFKTKQDGRHLVISSEKDGNPISYETFMKNQGCLPFNEKYDSSKFSRDKASHNDSGVVVEVPASEMIILIKKDGYHHFYKVVANEQEADKFIEDLKNDQWFKYDFPIGTSFYLMQDIKEYRVVHSD